MHDVVTVLTAPSGYSALRLPAISNRQPASSQQSGRAVGQSDVGAWRAACVCHWGPPLVLLCLAILWMDAPRSPLPSHTHLFCSCFSSGSLRHALALCWPGRHALCTVLARQALYTLQCSTLDPCTESHQKLKFKTGSRSRPEAQCTIHSQLESRQRGVTKPRSKYKACHSSHSPTGEECCIGNNCSDHTKQRT